METSSTAWRRSSRSNESGDNCIELASVPMARRKASRSHDDGDACVELADATDVIAIRDGKNPPRTQDYPERR